MKGSGASNSVKSKKRDCLLDRNAGQSTIDLCKEGTWTVDPTWSIRLPPVSEDKGQWDDSCTCLLHEVSATTLFDRGTLLAIRGFAKAIHCMQIRVFSVEKLVENSKKCLTMF